VWRPLVRLRVSAAAPPMTIRAAPESMKPALTPTLSMMVVAMTGAIAMAPAMPASHRPRALARWRLQRRRIAGFQRGQIARLERRRIARLERRRIARGSPAGLRADQRDRELQTHQLLVDAAQPPQLALEVRCSPAAGGKKNSGKYARYANAKTSTSRFSAGESRRIARTHSCCTG